MSVFVSPPAVYPTGSSAFGFSPPPLHHASDDVSGFQCADVFGGVTTENDHGLPSTKPTGAQMPIERRERVLLRPWLEHLIDSDSVPGLEWIDEPRTMFKVPWKHRSKKNWSLLHSCVFLEWAKNTGRWMDGDPEPNYAQLKTRLRCAFNKAPDIEEMKSLHLMKCDEPYKVYRFAARRDGKLRPFARTFVTRASIPQANRRRRRRCNHQTAGVTAADLKSIGAPRQLNCANYNLNGSYCASSEYSSISQLQKLEETAASGDVPNHSPGKSHIVPLEIQTNLEDIKPDITQLEPRRRILPEPEGGFEYFQPVQFRSVRSQSGVPSSMPTAIMGRPIGMRRASMVAEDTQKDTDRTVNKTLDRYNAIRNETQNCYHLASSTFVSGAVRKSSSCVSTDNYEEKSGMSSLQSDNESLPSLSPVFSDAFNNNSPLSNSSDLPTKPKLPPVQLNEDISAPRLHRLKARYRMELQQRQHFAEEQLHQESSKKCESSEDIQLEPSYPLRLTLQNEGSLHQSSKVPGVRMLPVTAITDSIAMLDFGKRVLPNDDTDRLTMFQSEHISDQWNGVSRVESHSRQQHRPSEKILDERSWISEGWGQCRSSDVWESKQLRQDEFPADGYSLDMVESLPHKRFPSKWVDSGDNLRSPTDFKKPYFESQKGLHYNRKNEDNYFHNDNGWTEISPMSDDDGQTAWELVPNAVDLTCRTDYGNDDDVIDLSLRAPNTSACMTQNHDTEQYKTMLFKAEDQQSQQTMIGMAPPTVAIEADLTEYAMQLKHKTELIASKTAVLVSRERQLEVLEKQLAAREEALAYHARRLSASPPVSFPSRVLPHTPDHPGPMPVHQMNRSSTVTRLPSEYMDVDYYGLGTRNSQVSPATCEFTDAKRARMEEHAFNGVTMSRNSNHGQVVFDTPLLVQHQRRSVKENDSSAPAFRSATEQEWNHSRWPPSRPPMISQNQLDSFYMSRKRGKPKVSIGNNRLYHQQVMMGASAMRNNQHRLPIGNNQPERKFLEDVPDRHLSANMSRSRQNGFPEQVKTDSTVLRSPVSVGGQVFSSEPTKLQHCKNGLISASMPETVHLLMKSSAPTMSSYSLTSVTSPNRHGEQVHCQPIYFPDSSIRPQKEMPS